MRSRKLKHGVCMLNSIGKTLFLLLVILSAIGTKNLYAQEASSIFDEGVDTTIRAEDIGDDVRMWAQNTAIQLTKALRKVKQLSSDQKRKFLEEAIQESVEEAQTQRELLLMRFALNRALAINKFFDDTSSELAYQFVLIPSIKEAIALYNEADLPYLNANQDREIPTQEIGVPPYAAFTRANMHYLLNISNIHPSYKTQFELLRLSIVWMVNDILRSPQAKRNSTNANIILDLKKIYSKYENTPESDITYTLNNSLRAEILEAYKTLVVESNAAKIPAFMVYSAPNHPHENIEIAAPKPKEENSLLTRMLAMKKDAKEYSATRYGYFNTGIGGGTYTQTSDNEEKTQGMIALQFKVFHYETPEAGQEAYGAKGDFIRVGTEFPRQNIEILGAKWAWPVSDHLALGPYIRILKRTRDNTRLTEDTRWLNAGINWQIQPFDSKKLTINIATYYVPDPKWGAVTLKHFTMGDVSEGWRNDLAAREAQYQDEWTQQIQSSQQRATQLQGVGYRRYTDEQGREWIDVPGAGRENDHKILTDGDRNTLISQENMFERRRRAFVVEADARLVGSFKRYNDIALTLGGYYENMMMEDFKRNLPQTNAQIYKTRFENHGLHGTLEFRLWDSERKGINHYWDRPTYSYRDEEYTWSAPDYDKKDVTFGPTLVISYDMDDNQIGKNFVSYFNADRAKDIPSQTEVLQVYITFDW